MTLKPSDQVFAYWRKHQGRPQACRFTAARRKLIDRALVDYSAEDLICLVRYAYEADEGGPRHWRGENRQGRTYLDLTNLLSKADRLPGRVEEALAWAAKQQARQAPLDVSPTDLLAALANRTPGQPAEVTVREPEPEPELATTRGRTTRPTTARAYRPKKLASW